jgi:hypothetical protein
MQIGTAQSMLKVPPNFEAEKYFESSTDLSFTLALKLAAEQGNSHAGGITCHQLMSNLQ